MEIIDDSTGQCQRAHEKDNCTDYDVEKDCSKTTISRRVNYESKVTKKADYGHITARTGVFTRIDSHRYDGKTLLHIACRDGHLEDVKKLVVAESGRNATDWHQLYSDSERDCAKCHRKMAMVLPTGRDYRYQNPECMELKQRPKTSIFSPGSLEVAKRLGNKSSSCNPNCHDKEGYTPLHIAAHNDHAEIAKFLLRVDCHPGIETNSGKTPLHLACERGHLDVVRYLVTGNLSDSNGSLNARDRDGRTALHYTCLGGYLQIVKLLVDQCHCDLSATDNELRTALHFGCIGGHLDVVVHLIEHNCKPTVPDQHGFASLHIASMYGHRDIVVYLVDRKLCDPEHKTKFGKTARTIAEEKGHSIIVEYFDEVAASTSTTTTCTNYNSSDDNPTSLAQGPKTGLPDRPKRLRDFKKLKERLKTFHQPPYPWPRNRPSGKELAEVGFFYRGFEECVKCHSCGVEISRWENESKPLLLHYIKGRSCSFLQTYFKSEIDRLSSDPSAQHYSEKYANSSARLHSFTSWPLGHIVTSYQLASVGFYYTQEGTKVQCFSCGLTHKDWKTGAIPLLVHRKNNPLCQFLNTLINKPAPAPIPMPTPPITPTELPLPPSKQPSTPTPSTLSPSSQKDLSRPDWVNEHVRLKSFKYLPAKVPISKEDCAKAGLYFVKKPDVMKCFSCDKIVRDWIDGDVPVEKHREVSPMCKFLKEFFPTKLDKKLSESSDEGFDPSRLPEPDFSEADLEMLARKKLVVAEPYTYETVQSPVMGEHRQSDITPGFSQLSFSDSQFGTSRFQPSYARELPPQQRPLPSLLHQPQIAYHMQQPETPRSSALVTGSSVMDSFASARSNQTASSAHSIRQSLGSVSGSIASNNSFSSAYARKELAPPTSHFYPTPREEYVSPELRPYQHNTTSAQVLPQQSLAFNTAAGTKGSTDRPIALPPSYYGGPIRPPRSLPAMQQQAYRLTTTSVTSAPQYHTAPHHPAAPHYPVAGAVIGMEDNRMCVVCMDAPLEMVIVPCGHVCLCARCSTQVTHCPMCRRKKMDVMKVFLPY